MAEFTESDVELRELENDVTFARDTSAEHPQATKSELWSWYIYDFAGQAFSSAAMAIFIPLILEDLAWRSGTSDPSNPKYPPCIDRSNLPPNTDPTCFVKFGYINVKPVSFALYVTSISVAIQVISFISFGAFADYSRYRKLLLVIFSCINAFMSIAFLTVVSPSLYPLAATLTILANVAYGTAMVFYNAYLPLLVEAHPNVRAFKHSAEMELRTLSDQDYGGLGESLNLVKEETLKNLQDLTDKTANQVSTYGLAFGYIGGVLSLLIFAGILYGFGMQTYIMQICVAICGVWLLAGLLAFTVPWLKTRPGPPLPKNEKSFILFSWKKTFKTFARAKRLKNAFLFLLSWFFYSDGYSTIGQAAILFGKSTLNMTNLQLMVISILAPLMAVIGNYFFFFVFCKKLGWSSKACTVMLIVLVSLIPVWGILGFFFPASWPVGVRSVTEMYILGAYYGFLLGALQSFSRALFADLVPSGMESEFFALYEITDRGSSWLGPLLVGIFTQSFGSRFSFVAIFIILALSIPFLLLVNVPEGRKQAKEFKIEE